ncbi:hypothetical protein CBR_g31140 [Chara braunii]|uniref:REJ domain-containing protein n=1 Tax=Chara braunii TaxID=69332 RepID=A0A388LEF7_CHABU|nr:hypothetical protein CBR_g31140 [Chara braunii]|eukprot:GBG80681.1 hypothetical protein CBR_g31140 [Chara braunii]
MGCLLGPPAECSVKPYAVLLLCLLCTTPIRTVSDLETAAEVATAKILLDNDGARSNSTTTIAPSAGNPLVASSLSSSEPPIAPDTPAPSAGLPGSQNSSDTQPLVQPRNTPPPPPSEPSSPPVSVSSSSGSAAGSVVSTSTPAASMSKPSNGPSSPSGVSSSQSSPAQSEPSSASSASTGTSVTPSSSTPPPSTPGAPASVPQGSPSDVPSSPSSASPPTSAGSLPSSLSSDLPSSSSLGSPVSSAATSVPPSGPLSIASSDSQWRFNISAFGSDLSPSGASASSSGASEEAPAVKSPQPVAVPEAPSPPNIGAILGGVFAVAVACGMIVVGICWFQKTRDDQYVRHTPQDIGDL